MTMLARLRSFGRSPRVLAAVGLVLAAALIPAGSSVPAGADGEQKTLQLVPDVPVTVTAPAPSVPGYVATRKEAGVSPGEQTPDNCRTTASSYCDVYPLHFNVSPADIKANQWILLATLDWDPGTTVKNVPDLGDASTTSYAVRIYYDPPCDSAGAPPCPTDSSGSSLGDDGQGDDYVAASATGTAPPANIGGAQIDLTRKMAVTVAFYFAQPKPYKLTVELLKTGGSELPPDLSGDEAIPTTGARPSAFPAPARPAAPPSAPAAPAAPAVATAPAPSQPAPVAAPSFANGDATGLNGVNGTPLTGDQLAGLFTGRARAALPPPKDPSFWALLLVLVLLPVLAVGLPTGWMWRRRRQSAV